MKFKLLMFPFILFVIVTASALNVVFAGDLRIVDDKFRPWTITFSQSVDLNTVNEKSIYLTDETGTKFTDVTYQFSGNNQKITIHPQKAYELDKNYRLHITKNVRSTTNKQLSSYETMDFKVVIQPHITNVSLTYHSTLSNLIVSTSEKVSRVTVTINGETLQLSKGPHQKFDRTLLGLQIDDALALKAFGIDGNLIENKLVTVRE